MLPSVGVIFDGRPSLLLSFFVSRAEGVMGLEMSIAHGFVVTLNIDDPRRGIGSGAKLAVGPVFQ